MSASQQSRDNQRTRPWQLEPREAAVLAAILVAAALIYMPSIRYGWVFDDTTLIVRSYRLHSWAGIGKSFIYDSWWFRDPDKLPQSPYYRPLPKVWFGLNYMILGVHPAVWHLEKIVLELIGVILCFRLAQLLTKDTTIALLTAAIFGLMPANVESVVWNSAIGEPLSTIFEMGAMCCFINRKPGWSRGLVFALILYAAALLSHESAMLFLLIVAAYVFLIEGKRAGESMRLAAPFVLVAVAYLGARLNALGTAYFLSKPFVQPNSVLLGWEKPVAPHRPLDLILTAPVVLLDYIGVMVVPGIAGPAHNVEWITRASPITFVSVGLLVILAAAASALIWRSPDKRLYLFCAVWSVLNLAPAMKLNAVAYPVQDRFIYATSFGWSLALAIAVVRLAAVGPQTRALAAGAMALLLAAYAFAVVRTERYWHDNLTFFARCVAIEPHNVDYLRELVAELNQKGDLKAAMNELRQAVALDPNNPYLHLRLANQYASMQRGEDFRAEILKAQALQSGSSP